MEYIEGTEFKYKNTAITLGKFDGIHLGHQLLLNKILEQKSKGMTSVMFTFSSHPQNFFLHKNMEMIYTLEEKRILLDKWGLDVLISFPFTQKTASIKAYDFVKDFLIGKLDGKVIVVGKDFRFGHNREGDVELLKELSKEFNFELVVFDKRQLKDQIVSSTIIRKALQEGNLEYGNQLLGKPFTIIGKVEHWRKIGRTLGFPTTNISPTANKLLPPSGVYASNTKIKGKVYPGLTNIGNNPTVGATKEKKVETYIFDFDEDLYGELLEVEILKRFRPEIKFDTKDLLKEQMEYDIIEGKNYFNLD